MLGLQPCTSDEYAHTVQVKYLFGSVWSIGSSGLSSVSYDAEALMYIEPITGIDNWPSGFRTATTGPRSTFTTKWTYPMLTLLPFEEKVKRNVYCWPAGKVYAGRRRTEVLELGILLKSIMLGYQIIINVLVRDSKIHDAVTRPHAV